MRACCIKYCRSESFRGCGISFYRIPKKEPIRQKWIDAIGYVPKRKDPVVCSSHFRPEELTFAGLQAQLTPDAVPSIFPVVVIFGIMGACRRQELHDLKVKDVIDTQNMLTVRIMNSKKNQIDRKFAISGPYYKICKKYMDLRPIKAEINKYFFLRYFNGRCADQNIGINAFGAMGKVVAKELKLPSPELYTGHCFKRTSVNLLGTEDIRLVKMSWQLTSENKTLKTERDYSLSGKLQTEPTAPLIAAPPSPGPSQSTIDALDSDASTEYLEEPQDHLTPQRQVFSVSKASTKPQDPLKQDTKQCRFCGKYSEDCVPISPTHLASVTTKLAFNDIVVQFSESLPKTVCKDCDVKLQVIYDFVQYAKAAQELLIDVEDGEEVVEVKHEYEEDDETDDSLQEDNDSDEERKEQIVDLITAGETVFTKDNKKRKSNAIRVAKPKKTKVAKSESGNEEVIDRDDTDDEADNIGFSSSDTRTNKPSDAKFAKRVFVRKVRIDGNS
ncbi:uncharacterized protein LOC133532259 isoform X2 [Cydia pomonella]|uniref:uncharacterized protein LOC133532259 isoform X2 n=1 Tax=Cydia pomonella TaxID=82600 RepID=UPI002ADD929A|nr:uncharacterized protein LOC133532259 isoform X2 [Cydia pomonella]